MKHMPWIWPVVILVSAIAAGLLAFGESATPVRPFVALWFLLICPGMAFVRLLRLRDGLAELTLAVALSFAIDGLVSEVLVYAGQWSFKTGLAILIGIAFTGVAFDLLMIYTRVSAVVHLPQSPRRFTLNVSPTLRTIGWLVGGMLVGGVTVWTIASVGIVGDFDSLIGGNPSPALAVAGDTTEALTAPAPTKPTSPPTPVATSTPQPTALRAVEQGKLLVADSFAGGGWYQRTGKGWQVGYQGERYRIAADAKIGPIWAYRTLPDGNVGIGVDVQIANGEGGLVVGFLDESTFISFNIDPSRHTWQLARRRAHDSTVLIEGESRAILSDPGASNRLEARLHDGRIQMLVNGDTVGEQDLPNQLAERRYGLVAIAEAERAEVYFDNVEIRALQ